MSIMTEAERKRDEKVCVPLEVIHFLKYQSLSQA